MKIEVHHKDPEHGAFVHVADVECGAHFIDSMKGRPADLSAALEYAWRWTNNFDGSWSRGPELRVTHGGGSYTYDSLQPNGDHNPAVKVLAPLPQRFGQVMGHRSSMVGDVFKIDGKEYRVASLGFIDADGKEV